MDTILILYAPDVYEEDVVHPILKGPVQTIFMKIQQLEFT